MKFLKVATSRNLKEHHGTSRDMKQVRLGVNIDHVATLRQVRGTAYPDPVAAAMAVEKTGCFSIVAHLREDRRHIQDEDIYQLKNRLTRARLNLEMSAAEDILRCACNVLPYQATLVPEKRKELTTEGGLDLTRSADRIQKAVARLQKRKILVSLFIDPVPGQIKIARRIGADMIELHTGEYAEAGTQHMRQTELKKLQVAAGYAQSIGFTEIAAGHGLQYQNVLSVAAIPQIREFNIGHSIIAEAVFSGLPKAVRRMNALIQRAR